MSQGLSWTFFHPRSRCASSAPAVPAIRQPIAIADNARRAGRIDYQTEKSAAMGEGALARTTSSSTSVPIRTRRAAATSSPLATHLTSLSISARPMPFSRKRQSPSCYRTDARTGKSKAGAAIPTVIAPTINPTVADNESVSVTVVVVAVAAAICRPPNTARKA